MDAKVDNQVGRAICLLDGRIDLEGSARYSGALRRRRVVQSALDLLRLVMVYALTDYSLRLVGLWGTLMDWGSLSKNAVRKRLRQCQAWIGVLIVQVLVQGTLNVPSCAPYRLRLIDVSNVSQPGHRKIDWRLHLEVACHPLRIAGVQLTDGKVGESLTHWPVAANDLLLADRIYGVARSLGVVLGAGAFFVIRVGWHNLPLSDREGQRFVIADWLRVFSTDPAAPAAQTRVWVSTPQGRFPIRLIARAIPPEKAARIRQRLRAETKHKGRRLDERSLLAAGFVLVVSNLPDSYHAADILALYRFRWQVELVFKRLKSVLGFDRLRVTSDPQLAQVYLLTKLLVALLLGQAEWQLALSAPAAFQDAQRPLSRWRLQQVLLEIFRTAVCGVLTEERFLAHLPQLARYLCDEPRRRQRQSLVWAFPDILRCFYGAPTP
jgi:hypothetical protein